MFLLLAEAGNSGGLSSLFGNGNTIIFTIVYFVVIIGLMYFIMFRPQKKQQKEHKALIDRKHKLNLFKLKLMPSFDMGIPVAIPEE